MIARSLQPGVRALYRQLPDGRFVVRFSDRPRVFEGRAGEKLDTLVNGVLEAQRPELKARQLPFECDETLRAPT